MATTRKPRVTQELKTVVIPPSSEEGVATVEVLNELIKDKAEAKAKATKRTATINLQSTDIPPAGISVSAPQTVTMTVQDVQAMIQQAADAAAIAAKAQLTAVQAIEEDCAESPEMEALKKQVADLQASLKQTQDEKHQQEQAMDNLQAVTGITGRSQNYNGSVFTKISRSDRQSRLVQEFQSILESAPKVRKNVRDSISGVDSSWGQPNGTAMQQWLFSHIKEAEKDLGTKFRNVNSFQHLPIFQEYEDYLKRNGLFGSSSNVTFNAGVIPADIVGGFLPFLSGLMRFTHRSNYIMWQFPNIKIQWEKNRGDTMQVWRYALNTPPTTVSSWQLSGNGTFANLTDNRQGVQTGTVDVVLKEWGMGKIGATGNEPYFVANFTEQTSAIDIFNLFDINIARNYMIFEDLAIWSLITPTSAVVYINNNEIETNPLNLVVGSGGLCTASALRSEYEYMAAMKIPKYEGNYYAKILDDYSFNQLADSLVTIDRQAFLNPATMEEQLSVTSALQSITDIDQISGYHGVVSGFHIFSQNERGMGAPGTPGVQNVTTGAGSKKTRSTYNLGADSISRGVGMPMEIRSRTGEILWNRASEFAWFSHESFDPLDVDATGYSDTSDVPQQTRVIEVRYLATEL
jgi:hypothetical protein